jgi:HNH endonuclease
MSLKKLKELVYARALGLCEYCKSPANISSQPFILEHILPQSKGGETKEDNMALSCQGCNNYKYNKTTGIDKITLQDTPLFNPRQDEWEQHFAWSAEANEVLGITATGRVTVDTLKLNRQELKNLRSLLISVGKHPPE